jgi:hypothetical protein
MCYGVAISRPDRQLGSSAGELGELGVHPLRGLFRDSEHRADLAPGPAVAACDSHGIGECRLLSVATFCVLGDRLELGGVDLDEIRCVDVVGPRFERGCSLCSCRIHRIHHPFENFRRLA